MRIRLPLCTLTLIGLVTLGPGPCVAGTPFVAEVVDSVGNQGQYSSLALDVDGNPHTCYYDATNHDLKYAVRAVGVWTIETVDAAGDVGQHCALALDSRGNPHLSYYDATNQDLKYATKSGEVWTIQTVDSPGTVGLYTSIALDAQDTPHIAYRGFFGLTRAKRSGPTWTKTTVAGFGDLDATSIKIDSGGYARIAWHDYVNYSLDFAWESSTGWSYQTIWQGGGMYQGLFLDYGKHVSLALDKHDIPHLSYAGPFGLFYSTSIDPGTWSTETMDSTLYVTYTSIALDPSNLPHIAFGTFVYQNLAYVSKSAIGWTPKELVDVTGDVSQFPSLAMDAQGNPSIAYYDASNGNLKLTDSALHLLNPLGGQRWEVGSSQKVRWSGTGPVDIQMSSDGGAFYFTVLPAVSGGTANITVPYMSTANARVRLARYAPFSTSQSPGYMSVAPGLISPWWTTVVDNTSQAGYHGTSLTVDADGRPKIAYQDDTNGRLRYASKTGGVWTLENVAASGTPTIFTGTPCVSLALNSLGSPGIAYFDIVNKRLRYASRSGGVWATELVDNSTVADQYCSLAIDALGNPRISYFDAANQRLLYASKSSSVWTLETADGSAGSNLGYYNSLALDAQGDPHIAYADFANFMLKYASKVPGGWSTETVLPVGSSNPLYISLALDPHGNPGISYWDAADLNVKYVSKAEGVWTVETVDPSYFTGYFTSLRLDGEGHPHIGYYDPYNGRLMHAWKTGSTWVREAVDGLPSGGAGSVGQYASLALDTYMNPRLSYYDGGNGVMKYASSAIEGSAPQAGTTWPVGAVRSVDWTGTGRVDIWLSTDGGVTWLLKQAQATGGHLNLTVPHTPSHFCKIGLTRAVPYSLSVTDSFFSIQTSVQLLALLAAPFPNRAQGTIVSWSTDPGPADLAGYRLERASGSSAAWQALAPLTRETSYSDPDGSPGSRYRLTAVNGLGEEIFLGEVSTRPRAPLVAWPLPYRGGNLSISFATFGGLGGGAGRTEISIFDVSGRLVRTVAREAYSAGYQSAAWDGRDNRGRQVSAGIYFLSMRSASGDERTLKLAVLR